MKTNKIKINGELIVRRRSDVLRQPEMDIDPSSAPTSKRCKALPAAVQQTQTTSTASVESTRNPVSAAGGDRQTALGRVPSPPHLRPKLPPTIFAQRR
ncbi:hypothetical protein EVAR_19923_1 [Eumeta japonica]|uniref:Uncharacterized protein n=1 Tax=Eumeta variegata TaxID=151549 RepID=A0A4C1ZKB5_EUMVA|nr:hypothetical protein EVAR_19923_1 [Eumeta japonica]